MKYILTILILVCSFNTHADITYKGWNPPQYKDLRQATRLSSIECIAITLYHESRSESDVANMMIAGVILNRVADERFPNDICQVVFEPNQFSFLGDKYSDEIKDYKQYYRLYQLAERVLQNKKFAQGMTEGADHYHAIYVKPYWSMSIKFQYINRVDKHLFYKSRW